jgi:hypothetical protein
MTRRYHFGGRCPSMRRILAICIAIFVAIALPGSVAAAKPQPRVAIVVGPAEGLTDLYRSIGAAAAREARRWTSDVVVVASPSATWPAVKRALRGASIVVYLGHGNGFPSPYRDALYPPTQNGLGLNPVAGAGDATHQYFGEEFIGRDIDLAPGAVVLLHHLCYASGNSEPGLAEGSLEVGRKRVDNYAAGWLRAGAGAVIADTFGEPGPYLRALLTTDRQIGRIWHDAPNFHDHVLTFPSVRTPGAFGAMDPTHGTSGFNRSIVLQPGVRSGDLRTGAGQVATLPMSPNGAGVPGQGSLAALGVAIRTPSLAPAGPIPSGLVAGTRASLSLPIKAPAGVTLPAKLELGVRWDPLVLDQRPPAADVAGPAAPSTSGAKPTPPAAASAPPSAQPRPPGRPIPSLRPGDPSSSPVAEPPTIDLVAPEVPGTIVTPARATLSKGRLKLTVGLPANPGTYRLTTTVHGSDGVAFDAATQALVPVLTVRVSRPLSVAYGVVAELSLSAGASLTVPVRLANDGLLAWALPPVVGEDLIDPSLTRARPPSRLVAHWLRLSPGTTIDAAGASTPARVDPGGQTTVGLALVAPTAAGDYLVVLDIVSPVHGSLAATGVPIGQIRVTVSPAVTPAAP